LSSVLPEQQGKGDTRHYEKLLYPMIRTGDFDIDTEKLSVCLDYMPTPPANPPLFCASRSIDSTDSAFPSKVDYTLYPEVHKPLRIRMPLRIRI
jgi:hypothetical protein